MSRSGPVTKDTSTVALGLAQIRIGNSLANIATNTPVLAPANSIGALANTKFGGATDWWKLESGFPLLEDMTIPIRESASLECAFKEITPFNMALAYGLDPTEGKVDASVTGGVISGSGTTTGDIAVNNDGGVVDDDWTVTFSSATEYTISGSVTGALSGTGNVGTAFSPDNSGHPYFTIPANFFSGTWVSADTYTFSTVAYVAGSYDNPHTGEISLGARVAPKSVRMEAVYTYPNGTNKMTIIFPRGQVAADMEVDLQAEDAAAVPITFEAKRGDSEVEGGNAVWDTAPLGKIIFS